MSSFSGAELGEGRCYPPAMRFVKSVAVGLLATVAGFVAALTVWLLAGYAYVWTQMASGSGGIGAYSSGIQIPMLVSLAAGIAGFMWQWRRGRQVVSA